MRVGDPFVVVYYWKKFLSSAPAISEPGLGGHPFGWNYTTNQQEKKKEKKE